MPRCSDGGVDNGDWRAGVVGVASVLSRDITSSGHRMDCMGGGGDGVGGRE